MADPDYPFLAAAEPTRYKPHYRLEMSAKPNAPYVPHGGIQQRNAPQEEVRSYVTNPNRAMSPSSHQKPAPLPDESTHPTVTDHYNHRESIWRVVVDIISLLILTTVTVISHYIATPFSRGFTCADSTIKYPYKENTIPTYAAVLISICFPVVGMLTTEFLKLCYFTRYKKTPFRIRLEFWGRRKINVLPVVRNIYILTVVFTYGYLTTWVLTEVSKNFIGRLRPHFLSVCQPSFSCASLTNFSQFFSYLQDGVDYTCLNPDSTAVREARRSFISGHTSPVFYGCAFLIMYLHVAWSWRHLGIVGHLLQTGLAVLAFFIGATRIFDYHHHWQDVFSGAIVGSLVAFATFKFILNWRHYDSRFLPYIVSGDSSKFPTSNRNGDVFNSNSVPIGYDRYPDSSDRRF